VFCRRWILVATACAALLQAPAFAQQNPASGGTPEAPASAAKPDVVEIPLAPQPETKAAPSAPAPAALAEIRIPNFAACSIAELQHMVPELAHLKVASVQSSLAVLLNKIGASTVEIARKTPNLISHEAVVSEQGNLKMRDNYSFLVLRHASHSEGIVFDEFRVDLESGEKFETEEIEKAVASAASTPADLPTSVSSLPSGATAPMSQGFVSGWLHFYPANRPQSEFRYLGEQKMDGHHTLVVAFAQKPASVPMPAKVSFDNKIVSIFLQGVAWVDASDFRIVRLRTDLLSPPPGLGLRQLTADIQFAQTRLARVATPLWLPRNVVVTTNLNGITLRETHTYSDYRLFRAHTKILLNQ